MNASLPKEKAKYTYLQWHYKFSFLHFDSYFNASKYKMSFT